MPKQPRKYITPAEFGSLLEAVGQVGRNRTRDRTLVQVMYYHGLRVAEAISLQWSDIDWTTEKMHVARVKNGRDGVHPIQGGRGQELRSLRALKREAGDDNPEGYMFRSERGGPLSPDMVARIIERAGVIAGLGFHIHPHMLRHGAGYKLANRGVDTRTIQDYMGHSQISSTVIYTALASTKFKDIMRD
jgi:type 1 fimbriae regulatory protein FimB/type 1 fimbriae regulatory protein FimE